MRAGVRTVEVMEYLYSIIDVAMDEENKEDVIHSICSTFELSKAKAMQHYSNFYVRWYSHYKGTAKMPPPDRIEKNCYVYKSKIE